MNEFQLFWPMLNAWLMEQGLPEVMYGEALGWYRCLAAMGGAGSMLNFAKHFKYRVPSDDGWGRDHTELRQAL